MSSGNAPKRPGKRAPTRPSRPAGRATATTRSSGAPSATTRTDRSELARLRAENVRLFNETKEALERQTALAEILRVISGSPTDLQPVLDAIAESAARFCAAEDATLVLQRGGQLEPAAHEGVVPLNALAWPADRSTVSGRCMLERRTIHLPDVQAEAHEYPRGAAMSLAYGFHTIVATPVLREGVPIGAILLRRAEVRPFSDKQIDLLRTFADQAAIAIENVRLFNETKEALERQTALAEILRVISRSPTHVQPVLDAIVENALRFCAAEDAAVMLPSGDHLQLSAHRGAVPAANDLRYPNDGTSVSSRAFLEARTIAVQDLQTAIDLPLGAENARAGGYRAIVGAPLLQAGAAVGVIVLRRFDARPFSEREIGALETFAAQAVIAIENVRLFNETKEALERQTAIAEVLEAMSGSAGDLDRVFKAIVDNAVRICGATNGGLFRIEGDTFRLAANAGIFLQEQQTDEGTVRDPVARPGRDSLTGRVLLERRTQRIDDIRTDAEYRIPPSKNANAIRSMVGVPIVRGDEILGVIVARRTEVRPFSPREVDILETFARQAAIAIDNVRLFNETKEALERQTATGEVLKVISRSAFDLPRVLNTVIESATQLTHASAGTIWRLDGEAYRVAASSVSIPDEAMMETLRRKAIRPHEYDTALTRAALSRRPVQVEDVQTDPGYQSSVTRDVSPRTLLAVPLLREGVPIGVLVVGRKEVRPFNEKEIELAANFADQAVIAIENTRLLNEIQDKSQQLEAASKHKSEFLANMSHELRTPLNAIIGFSDVLEQRLFGELNEKQADYTRDIASSGRHLLELVNEILDLSKVEAGRMELDRTEFALAETIRAALAFVRERAASHRIELTAQLPEDLGTVAADERKVRQVLLNLLSNAVKFTPDGGRVAVHARRSDDEIQVSVQDTGIGIAPEDQPRVFEEFRQVGKTSDRSREGTGLGLTLAKRLIELHGGRIWIDSVVGTGTTFTFAIPVRGPAPTVT